MDAKSGIYHGHILHHRFTPKRRRFTYPVFTFSIDLDEIDECDRRLKLFGHNRFSLYSLRDGDHLGDPAKGIKANVIDLLRERGFEGAGEVDRVMMITQFRALGYVFNPVTFYYCYRAEKPVAWIAEVNNTFHQRHCYAFFGPNGGGQRPRAKHEGSSADNGAVTFRAEKVFYVSPFMEMDLTYRFRFQPLNGRLGVFIDDYKGEDPVLKTHIVGDWVPLSDWNLLKSFLRIPFMSAWIIAWIHWQALKIWLKRIPQVFRPLDGMKPGFKA